ncbi:hypothetical protein BC832DRAFT_537887 [Gaertneriomyces semiglobifer]|nr:hypothetical protein BC832DRAFT_537887 [Gaertneriomyces semiglobifer]
MSHNVNVNPIKRLVLTVKAEGTRSISEQCAFHEHVIVGTAQKVGDTTTIDIQGYLADLQLFAAHTHRLFPGYSSSQRDVRKSPAAGLFLTSSDELDSGTPLGPPPYTLRTRALSAINKLRFKESAIAAVTAGVIGVGSQQLGSALNWKNGVSSFVGAAVGILDPVVAGTPPNTASFNEKEKLNGFYLFQRVHADAAQRERQQERDHEYRMAQLEAEVEKLRLQVELARINRKSPNESFFEYLLKQQGSNGQAVAPFVKAKSWPTDATKTA